MPASAKIIELREILAARYPEPPRQPGSCIPTGIARFDHLLEGGLWRGAITELVSPAASAGSALVTATILRATAAAGSWLALIDGTDTFDPQPIDNATLARLLWVRCREAAQAVRAADLLLRDGNLPLILLDLRANSAAELRHIQSTSWHRLQRIVERSGCACLVIAPQPLVPSAEARLTLENRFDFRALSCEQNQLLEQLQIRLARQRHLKRILDFGIRNLDSEPLRAAG